jgi:hypothetical protein
MLAILELVAAVGALADSVQQHVIVEAERD